MISTTNIVYSGTQEVSGIGLDESIQSPLPLVFIRVGATRARASVVTSARVDICGSARMETIGQGLAGGAHGRDGILNLPGRSVCARAKLGRSVADTRAFSSLQKPAGCLPDTNPASIRMRSRRKPDIRDVLLALAAKEAATIPRIRQADSRGTEWQNQRNNAMSGNFYGSVRLEGRSSKDANAVAATTSSSGCNIRQNSGSVCSRRECLTKSLRRPEHTFVDSSCTRLRGRNDQHWVRHSELTDSYDGACATLNNNTHCMSTGNTASPVDTVKSFFDDFAVVPICLPREDGSRGPHPEGGSRTQNIRAPAASCGESSLGLLIERILAEASAVPSVRALTSSLAATLPSVAAVHSRSCHRDASLSAVHGITASDLIRTLALLRGYVDREIAIHERGDGTALRIEKLPPGKHLQDYYLIGPVLDVCLQPQQHSERHSQRPVVQKRLHSPERSQREETLKGKCARKACRRETCQLNQQETRPAISSSANDSRSTNGSALPDVKLSVEKRVQPRVLDEKNKDQGMTLPPTSSSHIEDNVGMRIFKELNKPEHTGGGSTVGRIVDEAATLQSELSEMNEEQAPETACTGGRPILRFAAARHLPVGVVNNPIKIIKSIDKQRIPASAGGDKLWRRLCERLLNLPSHPNVLAMEAILEDPNHFHFVFERLEGGELFAFLLREKVIEEHICQYIIYQILMALDHLHSHNLLHRDIKPENLVFRRRKQEVAERSNSTKCSTGASSCSQTSLSSSSSTLPPSSSSYESCSSSSSQSYSAATGDPSLMGAWSVSSKSSSSSSMSCSACPDMSKSLMVCHGSSTSSGAGISFVSSGVTARPEAHTSDRPSLFVDTSSMSARQRKVSYGVTATLSISHNSKKQEDGGHKNDEAFFLTRPHVLRQLQRDYELVLIDFDTCKMMEVPSEEYGEIVAGRRRLVGTYGYLAPEVLCGHPYSTQSDLWSVGIILYILMTGFPPLPMEEMNSACKSLNVFLQLHERHKGIAFDVAPLSESPLAQDLCRRLLCFSPKERLNSARVALSHPWFDTLNCARARETGMGMTPSCICDTPAAGQTLPSERRERMTFGDPHRSPRSCTPTHQSLRLPSSRAALESTTTPICVSGNPTSIASTSVASAMEPAHPPAVISMYRMPEQK